MPYLFTNPYRGTYEAAKQELAQRESELQFVLQRIEQLKQTIRSLEPLAHEEMVAPTATLSDLCANVLRSTEGIAMSARNVVDALGYQGIDVSGYSNPLAVMHTTLTRLCRPGSGFNKGRSPDGQPQYFFDSNTMNDAYRSGMRG